MRFGTTEEGNPPNKRTGSLRGPVKAVLLVLCGVVLALYAAVSPAALPACGGGAGLPAADGEAALPESPEEPYRVSCLFHNSDSHRLRTWNGDSVSQEISERFGVELEPVNSGIQYESTVKLLVASDSLPDILELQRDHVFSWLVRERKLWNLGPSIQKYGGYAAMAGKDTLELSRYNGSIYTLLNQSSTSPDGSGGWVINEEIYREMGSPPLRTLEDLEKYLSGLRGTMPGLSGGDFVHLQLDAAFDYSQLYVSFGGGRVPEYCEMNVWLDPETDRFDFIGRDPAFRETMLFLRRLYQQAALSPGCFLEQGEQVYEPLATGRFAVVCSADVTGSILDALTEWGGEGSAQGYRVIEPLRANSQVKGPVWSSGYSPMGKTEIAVSAGAADPERIYRMLDWLASPEGQVLLEFGPQGLYWEELDDGGMPVFNRAWYAAAPEEREEKGLSAWNIVKNLDFVNRARLAGNAQLPEARKDRKTVWKAEVLDRHSCDISRLQNISPTCDGLENTAKILCGQLVESYLPRIVGAKEESEALYYLTELNHQVDQAGFQFVLSHYNWQYANSSGESGIGEERE